MPLNYSLKPLENVKIKDKIPLVTEEKIRQFISVGIRAISSVYALNAASWHINISTLNDTGADANTIFFRTPDTEQNNTYVEYRLDIGFESEFSNTLFIENASSSQKTLLLIDDDISSKKHYRVKFCGDIAMILLSANNDVVFFNIDLYAIIQKKSKFADTKHFQGINSIDQKAVEELRKEFSAQIFNAYFQTLKSLGVKVIRM